MSDELKDTRYLLTHHSSLLSHHFPLITHHFSQASFKQQPASYPRLHSTKSGHYAFTALRLFSQLRTL